MSFLSSNLMEEISPNPEVKQKSYINIWDKVFKSGPNKIMWKTAFKKFEGVWSA